MGFNGVNGRPKAWTHDEAIDAGRLWVERWGEPPTRSELNPAMLRRQIHRCEERLGHLRERAQRFDPGDMPGAAVVSSLFGGMDSFRHALGFTPRGTGRPPRGIASEHRAQATRVLEALHDGHRQVMALLERNVGVTQEELQYQRRRGPDLGPVEPDLDDLEAAGLVEAEVKVTYRLTSEGKARLEESGLELEPA